VRFEARRRDAQLDAAVHAVAHLGEVGGLDVAAQALGQRLQLRHRRGRVLHHQLHRAGAHDLAVEGGLDGLGLSAGCAGRHAGILVERSFHRDIHRLADGHAAAQQVGDHHSGHQQQEQQRPGQEHENEVTAGEWRVRGKSGHGGFLCGENGRGGETCTVFQSNATPQGGKK